MSIQEYSPSLSLFSHDSASAATADSRVNLRRLWRFLVCASLLATLIAWAFFYPQTGDGDAVMHYLNARDGFHQPVLLLGSWARVGAKLHLLLPAQFGVFPARCAAALVSILCAWQTIRLADDLGLPNAVLAAPLLILQPLVFDLAGDTMTELPMALALVISIRLWWANRWLASCLVMSYLPLIRPEGFLLCALWGLLLLFNRQIKNWPTRIAIGSSLAAGVIAWLIACWLLRDQPTYFFRGGWSWPADSSAYYGHGSFFAHFARWPQYCGPILFVLFILGGAPVLRQRFWLIWTIVLLLVAVINPAHVRDHWFLPALTLPLLIAIALAWRHEKIWLPWLIFLLIFTLHSVLWWRGWFGSCGLMRILACVSPVTAVICLRGWNVAANFLARANVTLPLRRAIAVAALLALTATPIIYYTQQPEHYRVFPLHQACKYLQSHNLIAASPMLVMGDPMATADLQLPPDVPNLMPHDCDRAKECAHLLNAPVGSVGIWDNQHALDWFHVDIPDLAPLGFDVLYEVDQPLHCRLYHWFSTAKTPPTQNYAVIRKSRPGHLPSDLAAATPIIAKE